MANCKVKVAGEVVLLVGHRWDTGVADGEAAWLPSYLGVWFGKQLAVDSLGGLIAG